MFITSVQYWHFWQDIEDHFSPFHFHPLQRFSVGATTLSITTFSIATLSLFGTLTINNQHNTIECHYAECRDFLFCYAECRSAECY
jgi:hypothetical protein